MKERPILFSAEMVRAILDGRKTQTRRVVKPPFEVHANGYITRPKGNERIAPYLCPYGVPGDRLYVRETWRAVMEGYCSYVEYRADGRSMDILDRDLLAGLKTLALRFCGARKDRHSEAWRPSIHMPRWASRTLLEVTEVRVERVASIKWDDVIEEGCPDRGLPDNNPMDWFHQLWDSIYAKRGFGWDVNPWVWVVGFKVLEPGEGE
jgi:hypothetical protein